MTRLKPVVLAIIDGWGVAPPWGGNATTLAKTPFINAAKKHYPHTLLEASGEAVGLPINERGNSEVGHLNIGAGQIVLQYYPSINQAIKDGSFYTNRPLIKACQRTKETRSALHLIGLVSPGGIHSHIDHLYAILELAKQQDCKEVCIHAITDGRDTPPFIAQEYLSYLNKHLKSLGFGRISTVMGRFYGMDRDHHWERIEKAYRAITEGIGPIAPTAEAAIAAAYRDGYSDEFIPPTVIQGENNSFRPLQDGDSVVFFNFRADRARELVTAVAKPDFNGFNRVKVLSNLYIVGFTFYKENLPIEVAFRPRDVEKPLAEVFAEAGLKQLHVAESEKYAHVTYFFNGGIEKSFVGEDRIVIPSPKVPSYDQVPEMSGELVTDRVIANLNRYDFIVLNYAAPDMVGHTGNLRAAIKACESVDRYLQKIDQAIKKIGGVLLITADHGNVEQIVNPHTGEPDTEHSANPVFFIIVADNYKDTILRPKGKLSDIAPTILEIMDLQKPTEMTGESLIIKETAVASPTTVIRETIPSAR